VEVNFAALATALDAFLGTTEVDLTAEVDIDELEVLDVDTLKWVCSSLPLPSLILPPLLLDLPCIRVHHSFFL
jgi:hypothetical protein